METSRLRQENFELKRKDTPISVMVGESNVFKNFLANLDKVTKTNGRVFLTVVQVVVRNGSKIYSCKF